MDGPPQQAPHDALVPGEFRSRLRPLLAAAVATTYVVVDQPVPAVLFVFGHDDTGKPTMALKFGADQYTFTPTEYGTTTGAPGMNTTGRIGRRRMLRGSGAAVAALGLMATTHWRGLPPVHAQQQEEPMSDTITNTKPTIVLVHGAFADASSWNDVISTLRTHGYPVVAAANPLRGVASDAATLASTLATITGPIVLVGHSYGGMVISAAASGTGQVNALVFVAAFAPAPGESAAALAGRFPGSTLGETLAPIALPDGSHDLYIRQDAFRAQFSADVPEPQAQRMAAAQRPITDRALNEPVSAAAWQTIPSWFVWGDSDKNIPPAALRSMAERAGGRELVEVAGASHALGVSYADTVAAVVLRAAAAVEQQLVPQPV